jgi:hypothetical protein
MSDEAKAAQIVQVLFDNAGVDGATLQEISEARSVLEHVESELDLRERTLQQHRLDLRKKSQKQELLGRFRRVVEWAKSRQVVSNSSDKSQARAKRGRLAHGSERDGASHVEDNGDVDDARIESESGMGTESTNNTNSTAGASDSDDSSDDTSTEDGRQRRYVHQMMDHSVLTVRFGKTLFRRAQALGDLVSVYKVQFGFTVDECSHEWGPDGCASGITDIGANIRQSEESMRAGLKWCKPAPPAGARKALDEVVEELFGEGDEYEDHVRAHMSSYACYIDDDRAHDDNDSIWGTLTLTLAIPTSLVSGYLQLANACSAC